MKIKNFKNMSIKRIFHDPIHKERVLDAGKPEELMIMELIDTVAFQRLRSCLLYTSPSPRDLGKSRMPSSA